MYLKDTFDSSVYLFKAVVGWGGASYPRERPEKNIGARLYLSDRCFATAVASSLPSRWSVGNIVVYTSERSSTIYPPTTKGYA